MAALKEAAAIFEDIANNNKKKATTVTQNNSNICTHTVLPVLRVQTRANANNTRADPWLEQAEVPAHNT
ncbi:hypothetical protein ACHAXR_002950 [Thalassiosira sp. AJA248-18]